MGKAKFPQLASIHRDTICLCSLLVLCCVVLWCRVVSWRMQSKGSYPLIKIEAEGINMVESKLGFQIIYTGCYFVRTSEQNKCMEMWTSNEPQHGIALLCRVRRHVLQCPKRVRRFLSTCCEA